MKLRIVLPVVYAVLFMASLLFLIEYANKTAFCGAYSVLITIPWSLAIGLVCGLFSYHPSMTAGVSIVSISALLNGFILYRVGKAMDK